MLRIACYAHSMNTHLSINIDSRLAAIINNKFHGKTENPDTGKRWKSKSEVAEYYLARGLGQASLIKNRPEKSRRQAAYLKYNIDPNTVNDSAEELAKENKWMKNSIVTLIRSIAWWKLDFRSSEALAASRIAGGLPPGVEDPDEVGIVGVAEPIATLIPEGSFHFELDYYDKPMLTSFYDYMLYLTKRRERIDAEDALDKA